MAKKGRGRLKKGVAFTVVELLIVVVVIAILATISVVAYRAVITNAQVTGVVAGFKGLEERMDLWVLREHNNKWPVDPIGGGGTSIANLIKNDPVFAEYVENVPSVQNVQTEDWFYDNDGDSKANCTNPYGGTNIVIRYVAHAVIGQQVDNAMDDGNINCGRIRYVDQRIFYSLSFTQDANND